MPKIDVTVTEHSLNEECEQIAKEIFQSEFLDQYGDSPDEDPEDYRDEMMERAHEFVDGHQWVIYTRYPLEMMLTCNTDMGAEWAADVGGPFDSLSETPTMIAFGEMRGRVEREIDNLIRDYEPPEAVDADEDEEEEDA